MAVEVKEIRGRQELKQYIHLPARLHKGHTSWLPPIYMDEWSFYDPRKNKAFSYCETLLAIAYKDHKPAGRIMGIINKRYNSIHMENNARFEFIEATDDQEVFHALISYVEDWARRNGIERLVGPMGFSDKEPQGLLINGYEYPAILDTACNHPYLVKLLENEGYVKFTDLGDYLIRIPEKMPDLYARVYNKVMNKNGFRVVEFKTRKELKPFIIPVFELINETYMPIYGFVPMEHSEMEEMARRYLPILDPDFVKVVMVEDLVVGFIISIPDIHEGLKKSNGHLFPLGLLFILKSLKKAKKLVLLLGAVKQGFRDKGIDAVLAVKILETAIRRGMYEIESHLILETNTKMTGEVLKAGGTVYKQFRIYQKEL